MTRTGFLLHPLAAQDISEIYEFIVEDNPLAAGRVRQDILNTIHSLVAFPKKGHKRSDLTSLDLRFILVREYLIVYAPETPLWIIAVLHTRRNPRVMAAIPKR